MRALSIDNRWWLPVLVFAASFALFSIGIGRSSIYILDESKNAQCAWEMMESASPVPTFNAAMRTDKPPLHYYAMMAGYAVWGKSAFAARFFSVLIGALFMSGFAVFVRRFAGSAVARWSVISLLSSIMWVAEFHLAVPDPYLIVFVGSALMLFFTYTEIWRAIFLWAMYVCLGLGILAKGPVAIALPALIFFVYLLITHQFRWSVLRKLHIVWGAVVCMLIALPWYIVVWNKTGGEWVAGFWLDHNLHRFASEKEGHGGIFLLTWVYFIAGLLPFSVFVVDVVRNAWRRRSDKLVLFCAAVVAVFLAFFSLSSTKLPNYAMPAFPFMAILLGNILPHIKYSASIVVAYWVLLVITVAISVALAVGVRFEPLLAHLRTLWIPLLFLPCTVALSLVLAYRREVRIAFYSTALAFVVASVVIWSDLVPTVDRFNPVAQTLPLLTKADTVRYYKTINPPYVFYMGVIENVADTQAVKRHLSHRGNLLITSRQKMRSDSAFWKQFPVLFEAKDVFDNNITVIVGPTVAQ